MPTDQNTMILGLAFISFVLISVIVSLLFRTQQKAMMAGKERARAILKSQLEIQQETIQQVSSEIHDNIGSLLSAIKLNLNNIEDNYPDNPLNHQVANINTMLAQAISEVRNLSKSMSLDFIEEHGLLNCIKFELDRLGKCGKPQMHFNPDAEMPDLKSSIEFVIYRIVQEVLSNINKHAGAANVYVNAEVQSRQSVITVRDDGRGFDTESIAARDAQLSGSGLKSIVRRMKAIGGKAIIESAPGAGTTIVLQIPNTPSNISKK